jgi:hypothetical protein
MGVRCTMFLAFSTIVGTWFLSKFLGLADMQVINITNGIRLVGALIYAFGRRVWLVYVADTLQSAAGLYRGMARLFLSRFIHADDLGICTFLGMTKTTTRVVHYDIDCRKSIRVMRNVGFVNAAR